MDDIQKLFSDLHPIGLCNHFYNDGFGTLWQTIVDVTDSTLKVCFGASTHNEYISFDLSGKKGIKAYPTIIPITDWY